MWEDYNELYGQLEDAKAQVQQQQRPCTAAARMRRAQDSAVFMRPMLLTMPLLCLPTTRTQVLAVAEKKRAALKRKVAAAVAAAKEELAEAATKVARISDTQAKLPDLSKVLQAAFS